MRKAPFTAILLATSMLAGTGLAHAEDVTLTIESWRNDDLQVWQEKIIPAFEKANPDIKVKFEPAAPTEYNAALNAKLAAGSAGDLITCRPFDASLDLYKKGYLTAVDDIDGMKNFSDVAKAAWQTDDGKTTFCVPMASVIHGFIYNADAFDELGVKPPKTHDEFIALLKKIKEDGTYIPLAMGTKDQWEAATMAYQNIGPMYWHGEEGRKALISGEQKLTDEGWVKPFEVIAGWAPYMGDGYKAQSYPDSQNLFTLGRAAIYPAGSWEISVFNKQADFKMGAFPPPLPKEGDTCYVSDQPDHALGMNKTSKHPEAAKKFLSWVASKDFAELYGNALPGFFPLTDEKIELKDPLAKEFLSWRENCKPTMRSTYQILSRGTPNLENETWTAAANVMNGIATPEEAGKKLQQGLDSWYKPGEAK